MSLIPPAPFSCQYSMLGVGRLLLCRLEFGVSTVQEISEAIQHLDVRGQMQLLRDLPAHLKIQPDDIAWLKAAEPAFEFWNNPEDAVYDEL